MSTTKTTATENTVAIVWVAFRVIAALTALLSFVLWASGGPKEFVETTTRITDGVFEASEQAKPIFSSFDQDPPNLNEARRLLPKLERYVEEKPSVMGVHLLTASEVILAAYEAEMIGEESALTPEDKELLYWEFMSDLVENNLSNRDFMSDAIISASISSQVSSDKARLIRKTMLETIYEKGDYLWATRMYIWLINLAR